MVKVVISDDGGFMISRAAFDRLVELGYQPTESDLMLYNGKLPSFADPDIERTDPRLIQVVEEFGDTAGGTDSYSSHLKIVEVPDDAEWHIVADNEWGDEEIHENHRVWK